MTAPMPPHQPGPLARSWRGPALATGAGLVALGAIALRDPNVAGNWPSCPYFELTGRFCPGCGSMRALHALTEGDLAAAVRSNPLAIAGFAVLTYVLIQAWDQVRRGDGTTRLPDPLQFRFAPVIVGVIIAVFWVVRNLPGFEALTPVG